MNALEKLCATLQQPVPALPLRIEHFEQWKPLVESRALNNEGELAQQLAGWMLDLTNKAIVEDRDVALALSAWTLAGVCMFADQPQPALERYLQAEAIFAAHGDLRKVAYLSVGLVSTLDQLGRYDEAIARGLRAIRALQDSADEVDQRRLASLYNNMGIACEHIGRYAEAVDFYGRKVAWWQARAYGTDAATAATEAARAQVNLGSAQKYLGLYVEAHRTFSAARLAFTQYIEEGSAKIDLARVDMHLAWLEVIRRNRPAIIAAALAQARASRAAIDPDGTSTDLAVLDLVEAEWLIRSAPPAMQQIQLDSSMRAKLVQLQQRLVQSGLAYEGSQATLLLAELDLQQGQYTAAAVGFAALGQAALQRGDVEITHLAGVGHARALHGLNDVGGALHVLNTTLTHAENIRKRLSDDVARVGYLEDKLPAYQALAALYLEQGDDISALRTVERARAKTLADLLSSQSEVQNNVHDDNPMALDFEGLCRGIPPDTLVVSYAVIHQQAWAFLADQQGLCCPPVCLGATLSLRTLQDGLDRVTAIARRPLEQIEAELDRHILTAQRALTAWHTAFVAPLRPWLERYRQLLVVPDGLLNLLPFRCLYDQQTSQYLVQSHEVVVLPSLLAWQQAAPVSSRNQTDFSRLAVGFSAGGRLAHAEAEARQVSLHFEPTTLLLGDDATQMAFAQAAPAAKLIHIASHAVYRPDAAQFSYIELADGRLEAKDILKLKLYAEGVVLSACDTATGRMTGNEVMGLVRAFLLAGAGAVVATHWRVDDQATTHLMTECARQLSQQKSLAQSLTAAQRAFIQISDEASDTAANALANKRLMYAHPFYWGAPAFIGRMS
jgi:CHAT domain-containing protein